MGASELSQSTESFQLFLSPTLLQYQKVNLWQWVAIIHITELQNCSLWKGSKNIPGPASCWKQSQLRNQSWLLTALSRYVLENLQGWKLHNHFGQSAHCLAVLIVKEFLLTFSLSLSCFISGLMPPVSVSCQCEQPPSVLSPPRTHWGCCWASPEPLLPAAPAQLHLSPLRGPVLQFPLTILVALHWTHCSFSRSLLK